MMPLALALVAAVGTHLIVTGVATAGDPGPTGFFPEDFGLRRNVRLWRPPPGVDGIDGWELGAMGGLASLATGVAGYALFGGAPAALATGLFGATLPTAASRRRRQTARRVANEAWPRMIEEIRVQTSSLGRSIPQALFEVGRRGPVELRPAFDAAEREWALTTVLERSFKVLKDRLADPTADATCETLLVAHELGGTDLDRRLAALADDRRDDVQRRKDARSRLAGARFARLFVLLVPAGMALAGTSIGSGRDAYRTSTGQAIVVVSLLLVVACWAWAGRVMRLPDPDRVFEA